MVERKNQRKGNEMTKKSSVEMTTYIIEFANDKKQKITVPTKWIVTFGPAAAGVNKKTSGYSGNVPLALRFYEGKNQRAIFTDVVSFRDMSIQIEEERVNIQEKEGYVEVGGIKKSVTFQAKSTEWFNPDKVEAQKLLPPSSNIDI